MQLLNSNYKSIFHKCSLACSFALENLSTHMQYHILDPSHFPFFSDFCNSITEFREREREIPAQCQFGQSNSKSQIPRSQKNGAFNNVVLLFSRCNKRTYIIILSNTVPKKAALVYCSPLPGLCLLKCKDCQVVWNLA
jgi:hypothetical protein